MSKLGGQEESAVVPLVNPGGQGPLAITPFGGMTHLGGLEASYQSPQQEQPAPQGCPSCPQTVPGGGAWCGSPPGFEPGAGAVLWPEPLSSSSASTPATPSPAIASSS